MKIRLSKSSLALVALALALPLTIALAIAAMPAPQLVIRDGGPVAQIRSDRAWTLLPGDCLSLRWEIDGERKVSIAGQERGGDGGERFCPQVFAPSPRIEWRESETNQYRSVQLDNFHLPDYLANLVGLLAIAALAGVAPLILWRNAPDDRPELRLWLAAVLLAALALALMRFNTRAATIVGILSLTRDLALTTEWQVFGALLAAALFLCLAAMALRQSLTAPQRADMLACGGFLLFIGMLYLPFGLGTIGHWEEWIARAWLEGMRFQPWDSQIAGRFWLLLSYAAGWMLTPESFHGMNLVYALILWGKLALFYGILRQLGVGALMAFLIAMLMGAYPVDKNLMSLRSMNLGAHVLFFLTSLFFMLRYRSTGSRRHLLFCWLAMALCVGAYETGFGLILATPLLWWRDRRLSWRNVNLTLAWLLVPLLKVAYLALIWLSGRGFYRSWSLQDGSENTLLDGALIVAENMAIALYETFVAGWLEALQALTQAQWLPWSGTCICLIALVAWLLWRAGADESLPEESAQWRRWLLCAACLMLPAVIVLIGSEGYSRNGWQIYIFVPFVAAPLVLSGLGLVTHRLGNGRSRGAVLALLCLLLLLPSLSRLYWRQADHVARADFKSDIIEQILRLAPGIKPETRVVVVSDLTQADHFRYHVYEMKSAMLGAALYVMHDGAASGSGRVCYPPQDCPPFRDWEAHLSDTLVFWLDADFQLRLIAQPQILSAAFEKIDYDAARLYDPAAPLPSRAFTMLGMSR